jgi:hypothetical protein
VAKCGNWQGFSPQTGTWDGFKPGCIPANTWDTEDEDEWVQEDADYWLLEGLETLEVKTCDSSWDGFTPTEAAWDPWNECEIPPSVANPLPDRTDDEGATGSFPTEQAFDPGGGSTLVYSAIDLPSGASINENTGLITYDLDTPGTGPVTVTLTTEYGSADDTFNWTVNEIPVTTSAWATESSGRWKTEESPGDWILEESP